MRALTNPLLLAGLVVALAACGGPSVADDGAIADSPDQGGGSPPPTKSAANSSIPSVFVNSWRYSHEVCRPDSDDPPSNKPISAWLLLHKDGSYELSVEGFPSFGHYRAYSTKGDSNELNAIELDNNFLDFELTGDTLVNWSEGEAQYPCGKVFVRDRI